MQEIIINEEFFPAIGSGRKDTTIREGQKFYTLGLTRLVSTDEERESIEVFIKKIELKHLRDLEQKDAWNDGFKSLPGLIFKLKEIYPTVTINTAMTIVSW